MKKPICLLLSAALSLSLLAACADKDAVPTTDGTKPTVDQTEPSQSTDGPSVPQVGDVLDAPEKTVSIGDVRDLTLTVSTSASYGIARSITYSVRNEDGAITFYERNAEADPFADGSYAYESICVADGSQICMYSNQDISGTGFQKVDLTGEYDRDDGYFRSELANLGFDHWDWIATDGFTKCEDTTYLGKECYVYKVAYTDHFGSAYKDEIYVDKQTGIWLRSERSLPGTEESFLMEVQAVEESSAVIPGSKPVGMQEQVVFERDGVVITAKTLDFSDPDHAVLTFETVNGTDRDIRATSRYFDINGLCIGGSMLSLRCGAGQTQQTAVELPNSILDRSGIQIIRDLELALQIEDIHTGDDGEVVSDGYLVEDTGALTVITECPQDYVQTVDKEGQVLIDTDGAYLAIRSFRVEDSGDAWLDAYCEDRMADPIRIVIDVKSINGIACDVRGEIAMQALSEGFGGFTIDRAALQKLGIGSIENVELSYCVYGGEIILEGSEVVSLTFA